MKLLSSLRNRLRKNLFKNDRGQGATEYILLLVVLVGVVMIFKKQISSTLSGKMDTLRGEIESVNSSDQ